MRSTYPSDISRAQFEQIHPLLESTRKKTSPRRVDLYEVFCAVRYLLKSGCQWRMLPTEFPKWRTVHSYFSIWSEPDENGISLLERALKKSGGRGAYQAGAQRHMTSFLIVDAQSVKNTDTATHKGYDAGKKVSGIKRHIAVDTQGLPHAIAVTTAEVTDRKGALQAMDRCQANLHRVQSVLADGGYVGQPFAEAVQGAIGATVQIAQRNELHTFAVIPKRWVVERSFAWLEKCRRLWKNCERKLNTSLQFIHLAFLTLLLKRL
ncbi:IS5 family transposase [Pseudolysobacter antarcticus]|uniref:IS5 family transposase n=1 Tax=Pseudolysobacter antarcticus TaxID=2511995 RepID=A0A411HLY8_9GAMM|nr:IS5 family transposase [Pseudolysobacter antarcticus]